MSEFIFIDTIFNEAKSPLRWYSRAEKRNEFRPCFGKVMEYQLLTPNDYILPFTIVRPYKNSAITSWVIKTEDGSVTYDMASALSYLLIKEFNEGSVIYYKGDIHGKMLHEGFYYSEIVDEEQRWYSEKFYVVPYTCGSNLAGNETFDNNTIDPWNNSTPHGTVVQPDPDRPGYYIFVNRVPFNQFIDDDILPTDNEFYEVSFDVRDTNKEPILIRFGENGDVVILYPFTPKRYYVTGKNTGADWENLLIWFGSDVDIGFEGHIDNIKVRKIAPCYESRYHRMRWSNSCGMIGNLYYKTGYYNEMFLDLETYPMELTPKIFIEGYENGFKDFVQNFSKRDSEYLIPFGLLPEYMVDALGEIPLHDTVQLILSNGNGQANIVRPTLSIKWDPEGMECLATTELKFLKPERSLADGCCDDEFESECNDMLCQTPATPLDPQLVSGFEPGAVTGPWDTASETVTGTNNSTGDIYPWSIVIPAGYYRLTIAFTVNGPYLLSVAGCTYLMNTGGGSPHVIFFQSDGSTPIDIYIEAQANELSGTFTILVEQIFLCFDMNNVSLNCDGHYEFISDGGNMVFTGGLPTNILLSGSITVLSGSIGGTGILLIIGGITILTMTNPGTYPYTFDPRDYTLPPGPLQFQLINSTPDTIVIERAFAIQGCTYQ